MNGETEPTMTSRRTPPDEARGPSGYWYRSTSIPEEREPATNAGKALDGAWPGSHIERLEWRRKIVAIEAEARALPAPVAGEHPVVRRGDDLVCLSCGARSYEPVAEPSDAD